MRADIFEPEHDDYREMVRAFIAKEVVPHLDEWERCGQIDRAVFRSGVAAGLYGLEIPEKYDGPGVSDYRHRLIVSEEMSRARATALNISFSNQDDLVIYYLNDLATDAQLDRWMPGIATGDVLGALAMTEPGAGSDLRSIRTMAEPSGDGWVLNGQKTFITHAPTADLVIVAARTPRADGAFKLSLFLVPADSPGFIRGRKLDKVGLRSQDTGELFFEDVPLPRDALLGEEGRGLNYLMSHLPRERLASSVCAVTDARAIFDLTASYVFDRQAFGGTLGDLQNTRFVLAEMSTELDLAELYVDRQITEFNAGTLSAVDAAKSKWWTTELQTRVIDRCVQLHGGYGFMLEHPVARAYVDARIQTIYGGATEVMKEIIGRDIAQRFRPSERER